jgi:hypothetical protein
MCKLKGTEERGRGAGNVSLFPPSVLQPSPAHRLFSWATAYKHDLTSAEYKLCENIWLRMYPEVGGSRFHRNVGTGVTSYMTALCRINVVLVM